MKKHSTLFDICKKTGVSTATVSRVINQSPHVLPKTQMKVMQAMRELNYQPSHAARILAGQKTSMIGVLFPEMAGGFYADVLSGIGEVAAKSGYRVVTAFSRCEKEMQENLNLFVRERRVDALIVMNLFTSTGPMIEAACREGLAVVLLDRPAADVAVPTVSIDNIGGAEVAVSHLLNRGHRRIAFITGPDDNFDAQQRLEGARAALVRAGVSLPPEMIWQGDFGETSARKAVLQHLRRGRPLPQAIFAFNDTMAISAMATLQGRGYCVPDDVAIVGFDDIDAARHLGLTSVHFPRRQMGMVAASFTVETVRRREADAPTVLMPVCLAVRRSTMPTPALTDPPRGPVTRNSES